MLPIIFLLTSWVQYQEKPFFADSGIELRAKCIGIAPTLYSMKVNGKTAWVTNNDVKHLTILIEVKVTDDTKKLTYYSWGGSKRFGAKLPTIKDNLGNQYKTIVVREFNISLAMKSDEVSLYGGKNGEDSLIDVLIIETPIEKAETLSIEFPLSNLEMTGSTTFHLSRKDWASPKRALDRYKVGDELFTTRKIILSSNSDDALTILYAMSRKGEQDIIIRGQSTPVDKDEVLAFVAHDYWTSKVKYKGSEYFISNNFLDQATKLAGDNYKKLKMEERERFRKEAEQERKQRAADMKNKEEAAAMKKLLEDEAKAAELLKHAKRWLSEGDKELAMRRLDELLKRFPASAVAAEAKEMKGKIK